MSEGGGKGGHFKLILALVLIVGIMGLVAYANSGEKFLEAFKIGKFANVQQPATAEPFSISMHTGTTALYGKSFSVVGGYFSFDGVCSLVMIGELTMESDETRCSVSVDGFTGTFQYSQYGSVMFTGSGDAVRMGSTKYSAATPVSFEFEVIPTGFTVSGINANSVSLIAPSGKIEKYAKDGSLKAVAFLSQNTLDINSLLANAQLENGELKVTGTATSVKSEEFSW